MTTVGYGDLYPRTDPGRAMALTVMVVGIGFGTLLIGAAAERFVAPDVRAETAEIEASEEALLREVKALSARLHSIEDALERRG
jgi:hypothetical protein